MRRLASALPWQGLLLGFASVVLTLLVAEIALRFTSLGTPPAKVTVPTLRGFLQCYRSKDPALPIDLRVPEQRSAVARILYAGDGGAMPLGANRCVAYDLRVRRRGTHPERARQVAIVGDSFAFGEGVTDAGSIGAQLAERFPSVGFRNLAVMGADSRDMKELVDRALEDPRPPTDIVYFYNLNDVRRTAEMARRGTEARRGLQQLVDDGAGQGFVAAHSALGRFVERTWADVSTSRFTIRWMLELYSDPANARGVEETWADVRALSASARARGADFWFVIYPWMARDFLGRYPFEPIHRAVMHACEGWGVHCIDGETAFSGDRRMAAYVVDRHDEHPNGAAHRKMADHLAGLPSFLGGGRSVAPPVPVRPVPLPVAALSPASSEVTEDDVVGPIGEHHRAGAMLSFEVEPGNATAYVLTLRARATPCRDDAGTEWPTVGVYRDDEPVASFRVDGVEEKTFTSAAFPVTRASRIGFVLLDDYEGPGCRRSVRVESFGIGEATPGGR